MARNFDNLDPTKAGVGTIGGRGFKRTEREKKNARGRQVPADKDEQIARANAMRTQGRRGCKLTRITMAFSPINHAFLKIMAHSTGMTITEFTNYVVDRFRVEHPEIYEKAKEFIDFVAEIEKETPAGKEAKK